MTQTKEVIVTGVLVKINLLQEMKSLKSYEESTLFGGQLGSCHRAQDERRGSILEPTHGGDKVLP